MADQVFSDFSLRRTRRGVVFFNIRFAPGSVWTDVGQITFCVFVFAFSSYRFLTTVIFMSMMNAMYYAELFLGGGGGGGYTSNSKVL